MFFGVDSAIDPVVKCPGMLSEPLMRRQQLGLIVSRRPYRGPESKVVFESVANSVFTVPAANLLLRVSLCARNPSSDIPFMPLFTTC